MRFPRSALLILAGLAAFIARPARAQPCLYSFSGVVAQLDIVPNAGSEADTAPSLDIVPGETRVAYEFEVDFDRDARMFSVNLGEYSYQMSVFHADLRAENSSFAFPVPATDPSASGRGSDRRTLTNMTYDPALDYHTGQLGSDGVWIETSSLAPDGWQVNTWTPGQIFRFSELGRSSDGFLYATGTGYVTLDAITVIPEPAATAYLVSVMVGGLVVCRRRR